MITIAYTLIAVAVFALIVRNIDALETFLGLIGQSIGNWFSGGREE
jgi:hypothetical protein